MMNTADQTISDTQSAAVEFMGGDVWAWAWKLLGGASMTLINSIDTAAGPLGAFWWIVWLDSVLGASLAVKGGGFAAIRPFRFVTGPLSKFVVGGVLVVIGALFDHEVFGQDPSSIMHGTSLKIISGVLCFSILLEAAKKVDKAIGTGIADKLQEWRGK